MKNFLKIFSGGGSDEKYIENEINEFARKHNLEIISASTCFEKGSVNCNYMFVTVIFRKVTENE